MSFYSKPIYFEDTSIWSRFITYQLFNLLNWPYMKRKTPRIGGVRDNSFFTVSLAIVKVA